MNEGDIALTPLPQANGLPKPRPAVLLRQMPPFGDWLVCGVSTQLQQRVPDFDEVIRPADADFAGSGLKSASVIRLGYLTVLSGTRLLGIIGRVPSNRHRQLLERLSEHLQPS